MGNQMMKRLVWMTGALTSASFLFACETAPDDYRTIVSEPTGAFVQIDYTQHECFTPCTIKLDRRLRINVSKEGYKPQLFYIEPGRGDIRVKLELIAASDSVQSTDLPEL